MAHITAARSVLAVQNLAISTAYWTEILGFTLEQVDAPGWSFLSRDSVRLMLGECPTDRAASQLDNHSYFAYWYTDSADGLYHELLHKGAQLTSRPANKPWGLREFSLATPDGHRITCGQLL